MLFAAVGGRCCGDEAADDAVTLLFAAVGGIDVRERECGDESADDAVAMLFAAVGGGCWGARLRRGPESRDETVFECGESHPIHECMDPCSLGSGCHGGPRD